MAFQTGRIPRVKTMGGDSTAPHGESSERCVGTGTEEAAKAVGIQVPGGLV